MGCYNYYSTISIFYLPTSESFFTSVKYLPILRGKYQSTVSTTGNSLGANLATSSAMCLI
jgi:hypothetical protein